MTEYIELLICEAMDGYGANTYAIPEVSDNSIPDTAIFCYESGGFNNNLIGATASNTIRERYLHVIIRHKTYHTGEELANEIWSALHRRTISNIIDLKTTTSYPIYLQKDDLERHRWGIDLIATTQNVDLI
jgi:hypothetical protein